MGTNINMNIPFMKDLSEVTGDFWKAKVFANGQEHILSEQDQNMLKFAEAIKFEKRRYKFGLGRKVGMARCTFTERATSMQWV